MLWALRGCKEESYCSCSHSPTSLSLSSLPPSLPASQSVVLPLGFGTVSVVGMNCPLAANAPTDVSMSILLPAGVPSGNYNVLLITKDQASQPLVCLNATFSF